MIVSCLVTTIVRAAAWQVEVVDSGLGGKYSSLKMDEYGNAHVSHFDASETLVNYSFWDHDLKKWFTTTLDRSSGFCSLALDSKQHPHVSYIEYGTGKIKYAHWNGSEWKKEAIGVDGRTLSYYTSITLSSADNPSITFYQEHSVNPEDKLRLRIASFNGTFWGIRTIDADEGSGKFNSVATDSTGNVQVAYGNVEYKNASLRYARWNGRSWEIEVIEGAGRPGTSMWSVSMVLDKVDVPHLSYTDVVKGIVKYATKQGGRWEFQDVDSLAKVGYPDRNGISLDRLGNPYISYYDAGRGLLKVAHQKNRKWIIEVVDQFFAGFSSSLQIKHGTIWLTYSDETGGRLKFARRPLEETDASSSQAPVTGR